jgi:hypothetical protein
MKSKLSAHHLLTTNTGALAGASGVASQVGLVKKAELSKRLSVCNRQIDEWIRKMVIPYVKIGPHCIRYDVEDVICELKRVYQVYPRDRR